MATRKLYYEDSHLAAFTAEVLACTEEDGRYAVELDATAFYPEGGGQAADTGTLNGIRVTDTRERGETILHFCEAPLEAGSTVEGRIDWEQRFTRMQQHSGEHMVSGIIHRRWGYHNTGFHMNLERIIIDFDGVIPQEALPEIEMEANRAIWQNLAVSCTVPSPEELQAIPYRTKRALPWPVRIVEFPGIDICACCGTHVSHTGEIGLIKLFSAIPFRGGTRMEIACGAPALALLNTVFEQNRQVSRQFSAQITQTGDMARQVNEQLAALKYRITELERAGFAATAAGYTGAGNVLHFADSLEPGSVRELADAIAGSCRGIAAVFSGDGKVYCYCLAHREADLRPLGKAMTAALNGRGGGRPNFQQGRVEASKEAIEAFFAANFPG